MKSLRSPPVRPPSLARALLVALTLAVVLSMLAPLFSPAQAQRPAAQRPAAQGTGAESRLQVKGSDTIGGSLGPKLAESYMASNPRVRIDWESLGSGTAFVGLFDGSADLGASSRSIKDSELAEASRLGLRLKEYILGYDGIAVLVHPSNPVRALTIDQLSSIFSGEITRWSQVGGPDAPITLISRPSYSGTHGFFKETVLRKGEKDGLEEFAPSTRWVEHSEQIVGEVAAAETAISYLGMGWVKPEVKAVAVAKEVGAPAVLPGPTTVRNGSYPVYRPLLLYTRGEPQGELRRFLSFVLAGSGRDLVEEEGFIAADTPSTVSRQAAGGGGPEIEVTRVRFPFGGTRLDPFARDTLDQMAAILKSDAGARLVIIGHADSQGRAEQNRAVSLARAQSVRSYLLARGVRPGQLTIEGKGSDQPIATNDTAAGRGENRRVDLRLLRER